jgi:hypothetical protein
MGLPAAALFGGKAATAAAPALPGFLAALGAAGETIFGNPFTAAIASNIGADILGGLTGSQSPFATAVGQQLQAGQQLIPQLQAQARGEPSVASQNIQRQLRQQTTSAQQSFAAGATARGGGGTPVAAQQARLREAETGALGNVLAQLQQQSQNALLGLGQTGLEQQNLLEIENARNKQAFAEGITDFFGRRAERQRLEPLLQKLGDRIEQAALGLMNLSGGGASDIPSGFEHQFTLGG